MADSDTQALLSNLLQNAGVSDLRIRTFFDHVQKFNNAVDPAWLTTGFENAKPLDLKYDPYSMQDAWTEKYDTFPGWNCRITACGLFGDFITVTGKADLDSAEDTLFMDYEHWILTRNPFAAMNGKSLMRCSPRLKLPIRPIFLPI